MQYTNFNSRQTSCWRVKNRAKYLFASVLNRLLIYENLFYILAMMSEDSGTGKFLEASIYIVTVSTVTVSNFIQTSPNSVSLHPSSYLALIFNWNFKLFYTIYINHIIL